MSSISDLANNKAGPVAQSDRIIILDSLRGIAILGILLMNIPGFSMAINGHDPSVLNEFGSINFKIWYVVDWLPAGTQRALFSMLFGAVAMSEQRTQQHIQIAEIDVDPAQLDSYEAAVAEQIEAAIRLEPGVLVLYSVANKENPAHVTVFEIYRDREAYLAHLQAPHFLKYKATVEKMVKSLKLIPVNPVALGTKAK